MMWDKVIALGIGLCVLLASQMGTAASERSGQGLRVFSEPESHCTLARDGTIIYDLMIGKKYDLPLGLGVASLSYHSHDDVVVTCTHKGFKKGSRTLKFGKMSVSVVAQPCYPPSDATDIERKDICKEYRATHEGRGDATYFGYPPNVQIPLEPLIREN